MTISKYIRLSDASVPIVPCLLVIRYFPAVTMDGLIASYGLVLTGLVAGRVG